MRLETSDPTRTAPPGRIQSTVLRRTLLACVAVICVAVLATYWDFTKPPYLTANDFSPDYVSASEWLDRGDPYDSLRALHRKHFADDRFALQYAPDQANPHPPAALVLTAPLTATGFRTARIIHLFLMMAAGWCAIWLFGRAVGLSPPVAALAGLVVIALPIAEYDTRWASAGELLLLLLILGWLQLRAGRESHAGVILGIAAALKIFPWLLVIPLLRSGKRKAAGWFVGTAGTLSIAAGLAVGIEPTRRFLTEALQGNYRAWRAAPHSISLVSAPFRLFSPESWTDTTAPIPTYVWALSFGMLGLCVAGALLTRARFSGDPFWATVPWVILASPIAWPHYLVIAAPLGILIIVRRRGIRPPMRWGVIVALAVLSLGVTFAIWTSDLLRLRLTYGTQVALMSVVVFALLLVAIGDAGMRARGPQALDRTSPLR